MTNRKKATATFESHKASSVLREAGVHLTCTTKDSHDSTSRFQDAAAKPSPQNNL